MTDPASTEPVIYSFDRPPAVDQDQWPALLGGKGAGLARMRALGLPVPPGFTIPTSVCNRVTDQGWFDQLDRAIDAALDELEATMGRRLGSAQEPLLVSVRSGAVVSMPGMMDTVLNVGTTPEVAAALSQTGDPRFGWDTYRRFIECYATIVAGADSDMVGALLAELRGARDLNQLDPGEYQALTSTFRQRLEDAGHSIPTDPRAQVRGAVEAVFASWGAPRAITYREREGVAHDLGTAANVQAMVFGNRAGTSGTGVVFTRDPSTGADGLVGDFLVGGQGEDVVAGTHLTQSIDEMTRVWPELAAELTTMASTLEHELADMVDIEFTVDDGTLWLLQSRVGKRSPRAALRLAVAMAEDDGFPLTRAEAVARVEAILDDPPTEAAESDDTEVTVLASGLAASPGRAVGAVCLDPDEAMRRGSDGEAVILVRPETSPADVHGMVEAAGLVTTLGGLVSHAAVVARSWDLPAVVGVAELTIEADGIRASDQQVAAGEIVTVDGDQGRILIGAHPGAGAEVAEVAILRAWRDGTHAGHGLHGDHMGLDGDRPDGGGEDATPAGCRRALALKGMATAESVAEMLGTSAATTAEVLEGLVAEGQAQAGPGDRFLLTPDGQSAVAADYGAEAEVAGPAIEPHFDRFNTVNLRFKEVVTSWQMREVGGEMVMNDHDDPDYDAGVVAALRTEIHEVIVEIIDSVAVAVPRLRAYLARLDHALGRVSAGELEMMANPLRESYHTVWFELHEEIIRLSGRNRADEAAAGRA